jgi:aarF domain-containing kinase
MRATLCRGPIGRGLSHSIPQLRPSLHCRVQTRAIGKRAYGKGGKYWGAGQRPPQFKGLVLASAATLSPIAFVKISEEDNGGTNETHEGRMLEVSREEIRKKVSEDSHGITRVWENIVLYADLYIWEPICTGGRFVHLFIIFIPVIFTIPAIWIGPRKKDRDNERSGTLWWYRFLVTSMERAGPAFIKVRISFYYQTCC